MEKLRERDKNILIRINNNWTIQPFKKLQFTTLSARVGGNFFLICDYPLASNPPNNISS